MNLSDPIRDVKGVGEALAAKLAVLGVKTAGDLIDFYPRRYEDFSVVTPIANLRPGPVTIEAKVKQAKGRYVRRGMHITEAVASDETSSVRLVWFNQPYRASGLKPDASYFISGNFELNHQHLQIMNPSCELVSDFPVNTARILPVYKLTKGLTSKQIRKVARELVPLIRELPETLPEWLIGEERLISRATAVENMHFPESPEKLARARRRLGFEEVFSLSLASQLVKKELATELAPEIKFDEKLAKDFVASLPFDLTGDQRKVAWRVFQDMKGDSGVSHLDAVQGSQEKRAIRTSSTVNERQTPADAAMRQEPDRAAGSVSGQGQAVRGVRPMNRLIEGDVGSGKTVVAAMAATIVMKQKFQVALMAPTEILAKQHAETLAKLLKPLGLDKKLGLLIGSMKSAQKTNARDAIKSGQIQFIVGTHALITESVDFKKLALVIIDEQHRFGVEQRRKLQKKAGHAVHTLSLTATPIPRSLALVVYGELDVSILAEKPPGRQPVHTEIVSPNSKPQLFDMVKKELDAGRQMFVVCPLITESETLDVNSAEKIYEQFSKKDFKNYKIGLLHGQMKSDDKEKVMADFVAHKLDILVSTTVIEVGVDVPNASVMMIEAPERFGLAQIHQLRGRVGRGGEESYCYLMMSDSKAPSRRLRALASLNDGFKLAELDLEIRGPGALYGQMQSGQLDLRVANLTDVKLITAARNAAKEFIEKEEKLAGYPELNRRVAGLQAVTTLN